ncbi:MAG TPA: autotransporter assembly complex family protein [Acetobacteraceae bacterium]|nr:autotransporter assembly complex family protein [Acetobacteraceae bacterium]
MRRLPLLTVIAALLLVRGSAFGAEPQPYAVTLQPTGNAALDQSLQDSSQLVSLREKAPVGPFALVTRARDDVGRFQTALNSFGYYAAKVTVTVDGRQLDDAALPDLLRQAPADPPVPVVAGFDTGPQFHLGRVTIEGDVPPSASDQLGLAPGAPAVAADVLAAQQRLLAAIREAGHPLAKVELPPVNLRPAEHLLDVDFRATEGPYANIGAISITGLKTVNEDYVRRRLLLRSGQRFSPSALQAAREDLIRIGVFSVVRIEPGKHVDPDGTIPILIDVTERPLHSVDVGAAYSTDLGANLTAGWHHRNLFGNAEQLNITGGIQLGGSAVQKPGYNLNIQFVKPDFLVRDETLELDLGAVDQSLDAYDQRALTQKIVIDRKLSVHWNVGIGVSGEQEEITQEDVTRRYNLVGLPLSVKFDNTNNLLDPTGGVRATLLLTPTQSLGGRSATFTIAQLSGSAYLDLSGSGRSVVAVRGLVGKAFGADVFSLPPDQRFYAGGSGTVRGFRYQSIGPQFPDGKPTGGTAVSAGSVELRQRILEHYGVVAFVDAGQVTANGAPLTSNWRVGAGIGARYYTSIGPIRLDVAIPLNREPHGDAFELYIGIGQAF